MKISFTRKIKKPANIESIILARKTKFPRKTLYQILIWNTPFSFYKNDVYKNVEAQKFPFFKNIVVNLLVAISISFEPQDEI